MVSSNQIAAYSFLVYIYNNKRQELQDLYDVFTPLVKRVVAKLFANEQYMDQSLKDLKTTIDNEYNLNIPYAVVRTIVKRIVIEEKQKGNQDFILYGDDALSIKNFLFADYEEEFHNSQGEIDHLVLFYENYLQNIEDCDPSSQPSLFEFIDQNRVHLSQQFANLEVTSTNDELSKFFIQAKFIDNIKGTKEYETLRNIYIGSIITSYLEVDVRDIRKDIELLLDTNFVIAVLNLGSEESYHTCESLLQIARNNNYKISVLPETIQEVRGLLQRHIREFSRSLLETVIDRESIYYSCYRQGLNAADLERISYNLETRLNKLNISIVPHGLERKVKFSEEFEYFRHLRDREESAKHDSIAILYVRQRRGQSTKDLSQINCWFVSNTPFKIAYSERFNEIIRAEDLLNLFWLSSPQITSTNQIMDASLTRLVSITLNKSLPKASLLKDLNHSLLKYVRANEITVQDVQRLAQIVADKTIQNGELERLVTVAREDKKSFITQVRQLSDEQESRKAHMSKEFSTLLERNEKEKEEFFRNLQQEYDIENKKREEETKRREEEAKKREEELKQEKLVSINSQLSVINGSLFAMENSKAICEKKCKQNMSLSLYIICILLILIASFVYYSVRNVGDSFKLFASIFSFSIAIIGILWAFIFKEKFDWLGVKEKIENYYRDKAYRDMSYFPENYDDLLLKRDELIVEKSKFL